MTTDICANNHGGNPQSVEAYKKIDKYRDTSRILAHLRTVDDATCDEVEQALEMNHQTCSARFSELKRHGVIAPTVKRKTRSGCMAMAWRVGL